MVPDMVPVVVVVVVVGAAVVLMVVSLVVSIVFLAQLSLDLFVLSVLVVAVAGEFFKNTAQVLA